MSVVTSECPCTGLLLVGGGGGGEEVLRRTGICRAGTEPSPVPHTSSQISQNGPSHLLSTIQLHCQTPLKNEHFSR